MPTLIVWNTCGREPALRWAPNRPVFEKTWSHNAIRPSGMCVYIYIYMAICRRKFCHVFVFFSPVYSKKWPKRDVANLPRLFVPFLYPLASKCAQNSNQSEILRKKAWDCSLGLFFRRKYKKLEHIGSTYTLDDRQITHLICVRLRLLPYDFFGGVLGLLYEKNNRKEAQNTLQKVI